MFLKVFKKNFCLLHTLTSIPANNAVTDKTGNSNEQRMNLHSAVAALVSC